MNHYAGGVFVPRALIVFVLASLAAAQSGTAPSSNGNSVAVPQGTALVVELAKSIDAKKARTGDAVKAKVTQDVISSGRIVVHRGSKLVGHITEAKAFSHDEPRSVLGVVFDRLTLKGGDEVTCNAVLQALAPPVLESDPLASSAYDAGAARGSQPVSRSTRDWTIDPRERRDHTRDDALRNAADPDRYGAGGNTLHGSSLGNGNRGVFGMPGVSLTSEAGAPGPALVSTKSTIKLESGTQMVLKVGSLDRR